MMNDLEAGKNDCEWRIRKLRKLNVFLFNFMFCVFCQPSILAVGDVIAPCVRLKSFIQEHEKENKRREEKL